MALRSMLRKTAGKTTPLTMLMRRRTSASIAIGSLNNNNYSRWGLMDICSRFRIFDPCRPAPGYNKVFPPSEVEKYNSQLLGSFGFDIDLDLGDHPDIIRPYPGSLDDPEITYQARFAVDIYNQRTDKDDRIQFGKVLRANYAGDAFFLTFYAINGTGKKENCRSIVDTVDTHMVVRKFSVLKYAYRKEELYNNPYQDVLQEIQMYEDLSDCYPKCEEQVDDSKCKEQVDDSECEEEDDDSEYDEAYEVYDSDDSGLVGGMKLRRAYYPYRSPLDDPEITAIAHFAVAQYNKDKNCQLHFLRVVKAYEQYHCHCLMYSLTLELDDMGEKKIYQAKVLPRVGRLRRMLLLYFMPLRN